MVEDSEIYAGFKVSANSVDYSGQQPVPWRFACVCFYVTAAWVYVTLNLLFALLLALPAYLYF